MGRIGRKISAAETKSRHAPAATIPADKESYQWQIEATDRQIDALVYELYGLTEEERRVAAETSSGGGTEG